MKMLKWIVCVMVLGSPLVMAGGGSFKMKDAKNYEVIVIGKVNRVIAVPLLPMNKKEHMGKSEVWTGQLGAEELQYMTIVYTGELKVTEVIKGKVIVGDKLRVTWTRLGINEVIKIDGELTSTFGIASACPHVSTQVDGGSGLVFGLKRVPRLTVEGKPVKMWVLVDGMIQDYYQHLLKESWKKVVIKKGKKISVENLAKLMQEALVGDKILLKYYAKVEVGESVKGKVIEVSVEGTTLWELLERLRAKKIFVDCEEGKISLSYDSLFGG